MALFGVAMLQDRPSSVEEDFAAAIGKAFNKVRIHRIDADNKWKDIRQIPCGVLLDAPSASDAVELLEAELRSLPMVSGDRDNWWLAIPCLTTGGFAIDLMRQGSAYRAWFGQLEEEFASLQEALVWVERALSGKYRLTTKSVGQRPYEHRLEPVTGQGPALAIGSFSVRSLFFQPAIEARCNVLPWGQRAELPLSGECREAPLTLPPVERDGDIHRAELAPHA